MGIEGLGLRCKERSRAAFLGRRSSETLIKGRCRHVVKVIRSSAELEGRQRVVLLLLEGYCVSRVVLEAGKRWSEKDGLFTSRRG